MFKGVKTTLEGLNMVNSELATKKAAPRFERDSALEVASQNHRRQPHHWLQAEPLHYFWHQWNHGSAPLWRGADDRFVFVKRSVQHNRQDGANKEAVDLGRFFERMGTICAITSHSSCGQQPPPDYPAQSRPGARCHSPRCRGLIRHRCRGRARRGRQSRRLGRW